MFRWEVGSSLLKSPQTWNSFTSYKNPFRRCGVSKSTQQWSEHRSSTKHFNLVVVLHLLFGVLCAVFLSAHARAENTANSVKLPTGTAPNSSLAPMIGAPVISNYDQKTYKAHSQNWVAVQDARGVMYFGNSNGILEFDGQRWQLIPSPGNLMVRALTIAADVAIAGSGASSTSNTRSTLAMPDCSVFIIDATCVSGIENCREYWMNACTSPSPI